MKVFKDGGLVFLLFLMVGISVLLLYPGASAQTAPALTNEDCVKCHSVPPVDMAEAGGKHKNVGCLGCHSGHPPTVKHPIPQCNECHMGQPHFELSDCLSCHKNPHTPLKITFAGNVTDACTTCHTQQIAQLRENQSKHTALDCSTCHSVHRQVPQCTQCHQPHSAEMETSECKKCHKAHMPKQVTYTAEIPSKDCGACHQQALDLLTASTAKHSSLACAFCHQEKHKMVPQCQDCHGTPHPTGMMVKFPKCGECHKIAHDLNNWSGTDMKQAPKEAPKTKQ